jgi:putative PIN family toxin of toxin-antitoxin system
MRIVADVNVLISASIAPLGISRAIVISCIAGQVDLVTADGMIADVNEKLRSARIRTKYQLSDAQIETTLSTLRTRAEVIRVPARWIRPVTGDPEDDYVLAAAALSGVDYLVTGDKGLLALTSHEGVAIVSPRAFLQVIQSSL